MWTTLRKIARTILLGRRLEKKSWAPTKEQMELIAKHYGYSTIITQGTIYGRFQQLIPIWVTIGGSHLPEGKTIVANNHRSFWHELGHVKTCLWFGTGLYLTLRNLVAAQFPIVVVLTIFGVCTPIWVVRSLALAALCWFADEILANIIGLRLSRRWGSIMRKA